jgi:hypothetical protein
MILFCPCKDKKNSGEIGQKFALLSMKINKIVKEMDLIRNRNHLAIQLLIDTIVTDVFWNEFLHFTYQ